MSLQLYVKRSKIFMAEQDGAEVRFVASVTANGQTLKAPDWIRHTATYQHGIKDGSIINLTPVALDDVKESEPDDADAQDTLDGDDGDDDGDSVPAGIDPGQPSASGRTTKKVAKKR